MNRNKRQINIAANVVAVTVLVSDLHDRSQYGEPIDHQENFARSVIPYCLFYSLPRVMSTLGKRKDREEDEAELLTHGFV
jgi:hypothetical protein